MQPIAAIFISLEKRIVQSNSESHFAIFRFRAEVFSSDGDLVERFLRGFTGRKLVGLEPDGEGRIRDWVLSEAKGIVDSFKGQLLDRRVPFDLDRSHGRFRRQSFDGRAAEFDEVIEGPILLLDLFQVSCGDHCCSQESIDGSREEA